MQKKINFTILVDTREQNPYEWSGHLARKTTLLTGDYSCMTTEKVYTNEITIERKTKSDIYSSLGHQRFRFEEECIRMKSYTYSSIVIESTIEGLLTPPYKTDMNPKSVINSLISWSIKYNIHIYFADNRIIGQTITYRILEKFVINKQRNNI